MQLRGKQEPRVDVSPGGQSDAGVDAVKLAAMCGLELDEWQQHVMRRALASRGDGRWAASEVGLVVARQNGKGAILLARELAGALLFGDRLIIHSAHEAETSRNHMQEWLRLIDSSSLLASKVKKTPMGRGSEAIEFKNGCRIRFRTRTRGGGRGLSADTVVIDEAFDFPTDAMAALYPTMSSRDNPQVWLASSAVDQMSHPNGLVLAKLRARAMSDEPGRLCWQEWSPDGEYDPADPQVWADTNPALGIRISPEHVAGEFDAMPSRMFAVERLSDGDWPDLDGPDGDDGPLRREVWAGCVDASAVMEDPVVFAVDVSADRSSASIAAAGWVDDVRCAVEMVDRRTGVGWVVDRVRQLVEDHDCAAVAVDGYTRLDGLEEACGQVPMLTSGASEMAEACALLVDAANDGHLTHLGQSDLAVAVANAETRSLSGGFAWKRSSDVDVSPLVAVTLAHWGVRRVGRLVSPAAEPFFMRG